MNPRNVFLLDGTTTASVQERLAAVLEDNRRRKEAKEAENGYQALQRNAFFANPPGHQFPTQDDLAQSYTQHQDPESNYSNNNRNLQSESGELEEYYRGVMMEPSKNNYTQLTSNNDFAQRGGDHKARQHVLSGDTSKYVASNQSVQLGAHSSRLTLWQAAEHRAISRQYPNLGDHEAETLSRRLIEHANPPSHLIRPETLEPSQNQHYYYQKKRRPRNGGRIWRNHNHFAGPRQQQTYQPSIRPQHEENRRYSTAYNPADLYDKEAWAQRRYETGQIPPPPNYFTRSTTFSESHSGSVTPTHMPRQNTDSDIHNPFFSQESHYPSDATNQNNNPTQTYIPHTINSMNLELDLPPSIDPYASQFTLAPSRKLQRRNGSFVRSEEDSQTSSGNYKGNPRAGIRELPDDLNCALWLTNLTADIQAHEVFDEIHTGAVTAFEITRPQGEYVMSAAKLIFKHPEAAARFKDQCESAEGIIIRGHRVNARYNTFGYQRYKCEGRSRMISIEGPSRYVVYDHFKVFFETFCDHELSGWEYVETAVKGNRKMIMGFARINGQATQCLEALQMHPVYGEHLIVEYAPDPCARDFP
ncbi:uncharacterized protein EAF01_011363 [Botrytis porri]|uniref:RRM domain-containing protein n=1 Tax=Botrytis porri TaxID=87229 RepID=A0A4Z1K7Y2_9HELO|nr:uncharacterized protein EAF01_011363 [Botrytis porri]KAF7885298.1 hypothetical protein EAF01_011363 [Botrytis porri]TGO82087.1 hypothetical protein BPOR_0925g00030 [Botrytis porri]